MHGCQFDLLHWYITCSHQKTCCWGKFYEWVCIIHMCLNTSKGTSCLRRSKLTFWYFLNDCSFISILEQKSFKSNIAFLRYSNIIEDVITDWWLMLILRKRLLQFGNLCKVLVFWQFRGHFFHVFTLNPLSNLKIKYWRFQDNVKSQDRLWDYILEYFDFASP